MTEITFEEWQADINRVPRKATQGRFTDLQFKAIEYARNIGVEWKNIVPLFNEKFGTDFSAGQLSNKWIYERDKYGCGE